MREGKKIKHPGRNDTEGQQKENRGNMKRTLCSVIKLMLHPTQDGAQANQQQGLLLPLYLFLMHCSLECWFVSLMCSGSILV